MYTYRYIYFLSTSLKEAVSTY